MWSLLFPNAFRLWSSQGEESPLVFRTASLPGLQLRTCVRTPEEAEVGCRLLPFGLALLGTCLSPNASFLFIVYESTEQDQVAPPLLHHFLDKEEILIG